MGASQHRANPEAGRSALRVAIVCPYDWSHPGGVKSHITGLAAALGRKDIDTDIIAPASAAEEGIVNAGRPVPIAFNGSVARLCFSPSAVGRIKNALSSGAFDLIHVHEPAIPSVSMLALAAGRYPAAATFHAAADGSLGYRAAKPVLQSIMNRLSVRIAVSTAAEALISRHFPGTYEIIPNGIDVARWSGAAPDPQVEKLKPVVLFVGRPEPRKGLDVFLQAMDVVRTRTGAAALVVGPRPRDVPDWVIAKGPVGPQNLPAIMRAADVFCAPSLGGESFGIVIAEAMAANVPVVCSNLPGYREAAAGAALEVPAGDPGRTADAIMTVLSDATRAGAMKRMGAARAKELDWDAVSAGIVDCYRKAISVRK